MGGPIHDDEPETGEFVARTLLSRALPQHSDAPLEQLATSGTDNAMWRVRTTDGPDLVVRLPRRPGAAAGAEREIALLRELGTTPLARHVRLPTVRFAGEPDACFPHRWSVLEWIDGTDAWAARHDPLTRAPGRLADDLAATVVSIRDTRVGAGRWRGPGDRGGPLRPLLDRLQGWLDDPTWNAAALVDVAAVRRLAAAAAEVVDEPVTHGFVHGDLIPGNLLVDDGHLVAVIDWGGAGHGDVAQDLAPAWSVLDATGRAAFRAALDVDEPTWRRGWAFELEHAVGGVLYYRPRRHPLGDVMHRTLGRIIESV